MLRKSSRPQLIGLLTALAVIAPPVAAQAKRERVALVLGNSAYVEARSLANPGRDADAIAATLTGKLNFKKENVLVYKNLKFQETIDALKKFQARAAGAEVAVIYYSGHGVAFNDANYLAPVDIPAKLVMHNNEKDRVVHLDEVQRAIVGARVGLIFWDACRTNGVSTVVGARQTSATRGMVPVRASAPAHGNSVGTFIAFSTNRADTALDGPAGRLSPFTAALVKRLAERTTFAQVMAAVSEDVAAATKRFGKVQQPDMHWTKLTRAALNFALLKLNNSQPKTNRRSSGSSAAISRPNKAKQPVGPPPGSGFIGFGR